MLVNTTLQVKLEQQLSELKDIDTTLVTTEMTKLEEIANSPCYYKVSEYTKTINYIYDTLKFFSSTNNKDKQ